MQQLEAELLQKKLPLSSCGFWGDRKLQRAARGTILIITSRILKLLCKNGKGRAAGSARTPGKLFWSQYKDVRALTVNSLTLDFTSDTDHKECLDVIWVSVCLFPQIPVRRLCKKREPFLQEFFFWTESIENYKTAYPKEVTNENTTGKANFILCLSPHMIYLTKIRLFRFYQKTTGHKTLNIFIFPITHNLQQVHKCFVCLYNSKTK